LTLPRFAAAVSLGANLGDARQALGSALAALAQLPTTEVVGVSSFYKTAPVDAEGPDYINAVALLQSALGPLEFLHALQAMELAHGRERPFRHAPRTLDLDLIWFGGATRSTRELTLPHPRWRERAFVVEPLAEALAAVGGLNLSGFAPLAASLPTQQTRQTMSAAQGIEKII
jgi:2-amino-4-hydroxy-6-hydroxymethyldihydropteridine diphosphokinase